MYDQLLDDTDSTSPRLKMLPHREIISAESVPSGGGRDRIKLSLRHSLYRNTTPGTDTEENSYDVVILGTGYNRQSWRDLVWKDGGLGDIFDLAGSDDCCGCGGYAGVNTPPEMLVSESRASESSSSNGSSSVFDTSSATMANSLGGVVKPAGGGGSGQAATNTPANGVPATVRVPPVDEVQRNYRLRLPSTTNTGNNFRPTVWLQGCNEMTHGISDSLLR
jgi:L-ornithine N5-oxygenase